MAEVNGLVLDPVDKRPSLDHVPGNYGLPIIGNTFPVLFDNRRFTQRMYDRYGPVYRNSVLFQRFLVLLRPDAAQWLLTDREQLLSSKLGWKASLGAFFSGGLMLRDFDDHRFHRRIVQAAFRRGAIEGYIPVIESLIERRFAQLGDGSHTLQLYPLVKSLTLDIAARVFLGVALGGDAAEVQRHFVNVVKATTGIVRAPIPGSAYWRGMKSRAALAKFLRAQIASRRATGGGDLLSQLCAATDPEGNVFSDDEIVDHMVFFLVAAHDTTASTMASLAYEFIRNPEWQDRCREEIGGQGGGPMNVATLESMTVLGACLKEALRMYPPVPLIPRRTLRACEFQEVSIPANTTLFLNLSFMHRLPDQWPDPDRFMPSRFIDESDAAEQRHQFAWFPFGGGAHMCSGYHLASLQVKLFFSVLLKSWRLLPSGKKDRGFSLFPIPKPRNGLPVRMTRIP